MPSRQAFSKGAWGGAFYVCSAPSQKRLVLGATHTEEKTKMSNSKVTLADFITDIRSLRIYFNESAASQESISSVCERMAVDLLSYSFLLTSTPKEIFDGLPEVSVPSKDDKSPSAEQERALNKRVKLAISAAKWAASTLSAADLQKYHDNERRLISDYTNAAKTKLPSAEKKERDAAKALEAAALEAFRKENKLTDQNLAAMSIAEKATAIDQGKPLVEAQRRDEMLQSLARQLVSLDDATMSNLVATLKQLKQAKADTLANALESVI